MTQRLAATLGRLRWPIVGLWLVLLAIAGVVAAPLPSLLTGSGWSVSGSESDGVEVALQHGFVARGESTVTLVVHDQWYSSSQPGFAKRAGRVIDEVAALKPLGVTSRLGYASTSGELRQDFVGRDGSTSIEVLGLGVDRGTAGQVVSMLQPDLSATYTSDGLDVSLVGPAAFWGEVNALTDSGLARAALVVLPLVLVLLIALSGGVVTALASLSVAVTSTLGGAALLSMVARVAELSPLALTSAAIVALCVGVDYSLFVTTRFKDELARGRTVDEALAVTLQTGGRRVLLAGATAIAVLAALFFVPLAVVTSIALGGVVAVALSMLTALGVLPAMLRILRPAVNGGRARVGRSGFPGTRWASLASRVRRYRLLLLGPALVAVVGLSLPVASFMTAPPDPLMLPSSSPIRQGFDRMQTGFGGGSTAPITVLVTSRTPLDTPDVSEAVVALERRLTALPSVDRVESALPALTSVASTSPLTALQPSVRSQLPPDVAAFVGHYVSLDGSRLVLDVIPTTGPSEQSTRELLEAARRAAASAGIPAATVQVGGEPADGLAVGALLADTLPRVIGVMLALSYLLLLVTWRSVLLPLKAVLVNLLWVGASVGILVALCQRGFGAPVLGVDGPAWMYGAVPVVLVVLLFSLDLSHELLVVRRAPVAVPTALTAADLSAEWVLEHVELQPAESRR